MGPTQIVGKVIVYTGYVIVCDSYIVHGLYHPGGPGTIQQDLILAFARAEHFHCCLVITEYMYVASVVFCTHKCVEGHYHIGSLQVTNICYRVVLVADLGSIG